MIEKKVYSFSGATNLNSVFAVNKKEVFTQFQNEFFHVLKKPFVKVVLIVFCWKTQEIHQGFVL